MLRRVAIYAVVIVVTVPVAVYLLSPDQTPGRNRGGTGGGYGFSRPTPKEPWKPSAKMDAEANADFGVDGGRKGNTPAAGKGQGADWPQYAGAQRDNKSRDTGLLPSWPPGGPELAWSTRGMGEGYSTVAVQNGVVYTMGNKGASEALIAVDAGTGEKIWSTPFAWASTLSAGNGPRSTPSVGDGLVFGLGGNGDLVCIDAKSGQIRWQQNILKEYGGSVPGWGLCESVLLDQQRLICTPGGEKATLVALEPQTGKLIWKSLVPGHDRVGYASAIAAEIDGVRQYIQFTAAGTVAVRADDGEFLWRDDSAANGTANCSSPLSVDHFVFTSSGYGVGGSLVKVSARGARMKSELVYHTHALSVHHGDMVIVDGLLYGSNDPGIATCLDLATGKPKWQSRAAAKGSVTYADGRIYLRTEQGPVVLIEATGDEYKELGRFEQPNRSKASAWPHPVVAEGKLFLRDEDRLFCYDLARPK